MTETYKHVPRRHSTLEKKARLEIGVHKGGRVGTKGLLEDSGTMTGATVAKIECRLSARPKPNMYGDGRRKVQRV